VPRLALVDFPFEHIAPGFVDHCTVTVAGEPVAITIRNQLITAELPSVQPGRVEVALHTPPLVRAAGSDSRMLGIAMPIIAQWNEGLRHSFTV
jgi:hypothetical protein